jgi:hypothetical protein
MLVTAHHSRCEFLPSLQLHVLQRLAHGCERRACDLLPVCGLTASVQLLAIFIIPSRAASSECNTRNTLDFHK